MASIADRTKENLVTPSNEIIIPRVRRRKRLPKAKPPPGPEPQAQSVRFSFVRAVVEGNSRS